MPDRTLTSWLCDPAGSSGLDKIRTEVSELFKKIQVYVSDLLSFRMETSQVFQDLSRSSKVTGQTSDARSGTSELETLTGTFDSRLLALELHIQETQGSVASPPKSARRSEILGEFQGTGTKSVKGSHREDESSGDQDGSTWKADYRGADDSGSS